MALEPSLAAGRPAATAKPGRDRVADAVALLILAVLVLVVSLPNLRSGNIDDLDSAHHLMDGYFFYDLLHGHLHGNPMHSVIAYHKQYPALGFLFWPPLVPFVLGLFDVIMGPHVLTARLCWLFFALVFVGGFYVILRREVGRWIALAAACSLVTLPGMFWSFNQVMLELPTLAFMMLAVLAVRWMMDRASAPDSYGRAVLVAAVCAAVVYAKQPAWFLYPALLAVVLAHPVLRRKREAYVAMVLMAVFCVPLALYMLKFGHADLAQSLGNNAQLNLKYVSIPRWSFAAWAFYPKLAWTLLNPVVLVLGLGGLVLGFTREFRRRHLLWLAWLCLFYVTFSYYDNRLARHATFWWPAWVALAASCVAWLMRRIPGRAMQFAPLVLLVPMVWQVPQGLRANYSDFRDERPIVASLYAEGRDPGNILLYGKDKQTFIALIREYDTARRDWAVRSERLLVQQSIAGACRRYRIGEVVVELAPGDSLSAHPELLPLQSAKEFQPEFDGSYDRRGQRMTVLGFRYTGPIDEKMADIPLSNELL
jgi:hypothetical protein